MRLDVVGRGWRGRCEAATEVPAGRAVTVMVRPEDISIASPSPAPMMAACAGPDGSRTRFSAVPTRSIFVETEEGRLNVDAPAFGGYAVGDNVTVAVPQSAAWAVVDQGETN